MRSAITVYDLDRSPSHDVRCTTCGQPLGWWNTDRLTGTLDRWGWQERAQRELDRARCLREPLAILLVDLDWFKRINDELGHPAGDTALQAVASVLRGGIRQQDVLGRYGGDEFLILLPGTSRSGAAALAERVVQAVATTTVEVTTTEGTAVTLDGLTVSAGLACRDSHDELDLPQLVLRADAALQRAKRGGRGRVSDAMGQWCRAS
ncbi:GGDEF domain-containing protein [Haloechinothrix sp. LS1_15]|uniref:GGDEF domain-containing protein n=1 Tax=Haloechinothrix sp. LS1_15 TaxID=2652248 RepID=UPI0029455CA5|nr:GGDEF domain-containing protein [Haloechinothrix sp. LS1_15]MDV6013257.1 GGDEF domain-containing protein [Haloechinothrix sp. LS1_15]